MIAYVDGKWTPAEEATHLRARPRPALRRRRVRGHPRLRRRAVPARRAPRRGWRPRRAPSRSSCPPSGPRSRRSAARRPRAQRYDDGYLRLVVTRGAGALGVSPHTCPRASLIVIAAPLALYPPERYRDGVRLVTSSLRRSAQRRAAAAGQEPQLPDERAGVDRGAPPGRRRGRAAQRAGPDRRVHRRQPLPRQRAAACCTPAVAQRRAARHHARARAAAARRAGHRVASRRRSRPPTRGPPTSCS